MARLCFIGLGTMGGPMAAHLARAGHQLHAYNRSPERAQRWSEQHSLPVAASLEEAVTAAEIIFTCLGGDDDVREVLLGGSGVFACAGARAIVVDHSTTSAQLAREMASKAEPQGCQFIDAPVSGGQRGAEEGVLTVMAGGDSAAFERVAPILGAYAKKYRLLGPAGSGQLAKMVNQICAAGVIQGLAEGIHFARSAGLDVAAVMEVISQGAAQSWQMDNRYQTMIDGEYDFGFAVDWMRKDLGYTLNEARRNHSYLPLTALVDQFYSEVQELGGGRWDTSSLLALLEHLRVGGNDSSC